MRMRKKQVKNGSCFFLFVGHTTVYVVTTPTHKQTIKQSNECGGEWGVKLKK